MHIAHNIVKGPTLRNANDLCIQFDYEKDIEHYHKKETGKLIAHNHCAG